MYQEDENLNPIQQTQTYPILEWFLQNLFGGVFTTEVTEEGEPRGIPSLLLPVEVEILNEAKRFYQLQQALDVTLP